MKNKQFCTFLLALGCLVACSGALVSCGDDSSSSLPGDSSSSNSASSSGFSSGSSPSGSSDSSGSSSSPNSSSGSPSGAPDSSSGGGTSSGTTHVHEYNKEIASEQYIKEQATCQTQAVYYKSCSCGEAGEQTFTYGDLKEHTYSEDWSTDDVYHWYAATCGCDLVKDKAMHELTESNTCQDCGYIMQATEGIVYDISDDGTFAYVESYTGSAAQVQIASMYQGVPVIGIGEGAFEELDTLINVYLPDSITLIESYAFYDCSNLTYNIYENCKYLGSKTNPYFSLMGTIDNTLTSYTIHEDTKVIAGEAFCYACNSLTSITIPDSVTSIGDYAFGECSNLTSVTFGENSQLSSIWFEAFSGCESLTNITIPNGVTSIYEGAFDYCSSLTSITLPGSVDSLGWAYVSQGLETPDGMLSIDGCVFSGCSSLTNINVAEDNANYKSIDGNLYNKDVTTLMQYAIGKTQTSFIIPDGVTSISDAAFHDCISLTSVKIPNSVTSIGDWAFAGCENLTSVKIPNGVTSISWSAFRDCTSLTSVEIPNGVTSIYEDAFRDCTSLTSVTIPDGVTSIGDDAFFACDNLTTISIPDSISYMRGDLFFGCNNLIYNIYENCKYLGNQNNPYVVLIEAIDISLTSYTIHKNTKVVYHEAFWACQNLKSITLPDHVTMVGDYAFWNCTSLTSVVIPDSVTSISGSAFRDCYHLADIRFEGTVEQWNAIEKGNRWNELVPATQVVCLDGVVTL